MKITPLAAESMGSRSMAVFVETLDRKILIDPGIIIEQNRFGLTPHPSEQWSYRKHKERIQLFAKLADIIVITHYHLTHFSPNDQELYRNKLLLIKNPNQKIDIHQRKRAFTFLKKIRGIPSEVNYIDEKSLAFGNTRIIFSPPVPHGPTENRGFVIQLAVHEGDQSFLFSSDTEGSCRKDQMEFILSQNPLFLYLDGPITTVPRDHVLEKTLNKSMANIKMIIQKTNVTTIIIDHHLLRDIQWRYHIEPLSVVAGQYHVKIQTAAEFRGEENHLAEARRNELYVSDPPK